MMCRPRCRSVVPLSALLSLCAAFAAHATAATELGIRGTQFTLNGEPTFLLGISYYGALGAPREFIQRDLDDLRGHRFNWIRVWATWGAFGNNVAAVDAQGKPREPFLAHLRWLLAECDRRGIVVDVTVSRGNGAVGSPRLQTLPAHRRAVESLVTALKARRNWYLDLANERNIRDKRFVPFDELRQLRDAAKRLDPARLLTASHAGDISPADLRAYLLKARLDFLSPHRPRNPRSPSQTEAKTHDTLARMKAIGRFVPVHYQEPFRRTFTKRWEPKAADFLADLRGALAGGAAGWCLHNGDNKRRPDHRPGRSFDLRKRRLFDQLDPEELQVANAAARTVAGATHAADPARIQPYPKNPRYWQFQGKPVMLLGGSDDDNLFQWTGKRLTDQLDLLKSVGGNYVRCTMSCCDDGNLWPFAKKGNQYDLDRWNDAFWRRFDHFLAETARRDIIVQIEVWAFHDFNGKHWDTSPWRPANTVSYGTANTTLKEHYGNIGHVPHGFFFTVPKLRNDSVVLGYQKKFVDKMLSHTLRYPHVLYCMTNEIHPAYSPEWGWYWSRYIRGQAAAAGTKAETAEMYWQPDLKGEQHRASLDHPDAYTFFEASQDSAVLNGQQQWDNLQFVRGRLARNTRPINHVKIYGADGSPWKKVTGRHAAECFWRNLIGGSASSRFHRPPWGLALGKTAQANIRSMRMLAESMDFFTCAPHNDLLSRREKNRAYATANPGREYAVYFPDGGRVDLDLRHATGKLTARWLDIARSRWTSNDTLRGGGTVTLIPPGKGHWAVWIARGH